MQGLLEHAVKPMLLTLALACCGGAQARDAVQAVDDWNAGLNAADRDAKYCKMSQSPFRFFRGSNHLFWSDLAGDSRLASFTSANTRTWIQGDLHTDNFGSYDDDNGDVVYALNDFDESLIADYQYDVWRMATSLVLVMRENGDLSASTQADMVDAFSESYLDALASYHGNDDELGVVITAQNAYGRLDDFLGDVESGNSRSAMLDDWTVMVAGVRTFDLSLDDLVAASGAETADILSAMSGYGQTLSGGFGYDGTYFAVKDVARRVNAGTGSLGTPRFYVLIEGPSGAQNDDRILDVKRQGKPTPYQFLDSATRAEYDNLFDNDAQRHAVAMDALTRHTDDHLGWMILGDGAYSVRERSPYKGAFPTTTLDTVTRFGKLAEQWGTILAAAHSAADQDYDPNYVDKSFDKQVDELTDTHHAEFRAIVRDVAFEYADQVDADFAAFTAVHGCP